MRESSLCALWWYGAKYNMAGHILPFFPPHQIYVEAFGGGASLLLAKKPASFEVYNDVDSGLVNFFRVLADAEKSKRLIQKAAVTPYSREFYDEFVRTHEDNEADDVERAWRFFVVARQSWSGKFAGGWSHGIGGLKDRRVRGWLHAVERLPEVTARLLQVQIEHMDGAACIAKYDGEHTLIYADPPYLLETRRGEAYKHEMSREQHEELVCNLLRARAMVLLSGYRNEVYEPLEGSGWHRHEFEVACTAAGERITEAGHTRLKESRTECLWTSPSAQAALESSDDLVGLYV